MESDVPNQSVDVESRVRGNTGPAAVAAGVLILVGFFALEMPDGDSILARASMVIVATLRFGGLAMAIVAVWCTLGQPLALLGDAVISCLIGASLAVCGVLMVVVGGAPGEALICTVCGVFFTSSGLRTWRLFLQLARSLDTDDADALGELGPVFEGGFNSHTRSESPRKRSAEGTEPVELVDMPSAEKQKRRPLAARTSRFAASDDAIRLGDPPAVEPPPRRAEKKRSGDQPRSEGYLADFGDKEPPSRA